MTTKNVTAIIDQVYQVSEKLYYLEYPHIILKKCLQEYEMVGPLRSIEPSLLAI